MWELKLHGLGGGGGGGGLHGGIRDSRTNRALEARLCEAVEMHGGRELQHWLHMPKLCGGWGVGVGVGADGPCSPGEKSRVARESGFSHASKKKNKI